MTEKLVTSKSQKPKKRQQAIRKIAIDVDEKDELNDLELIFQE